MTARDLPAPREQRRTCRSAERRRFLYQGSGSMPWARRMSAGSRAIARVWAGVSISPRYGDGARGPECKLGAGAVSNSWHRGGLAVGNAGSACGRELVQRVE